MKIKSGYVLREVVDLYVIIGTGSGAYRPDQIMSLNETGAFLWNILKDGAEKQDLVRDLVKEFAVDEQTAEKDVEVFLAQLRRNDLIDE